jgi:peptidoglycan/LPS O-acetylase OafA/YrhL
LEKIPFINGLRGLAIAGTVFHHSFFGMLQYGLAASSLPLLAQVLLSSGWLGVNLFFFLSGFVLYLPYAAGERSMLSRADAGRFYRRRFERLMPLYWFIALVSVVFLTRAELDQPVLYLAMLLYATVTFPFFPQTFMPPGNWVLWSIGVEIWFSLLFPLLVLLLHRFGWRALLASTLAVSLGVRLLGQVHFYQPPNILNFASDSMLGRLDEFVWGMVAARLFAGGEHRKLPAWSFPVGVALVLAAMWLWGRWYRQELPAWSAAFYSWPLDVGIFLAVCHLGRGAGLARSVLENRPLQLLGMMCFSIYVWHGIVILRYAQSFNHGPQYLGYLLVVLALAFVTYRYVEFRAVSSVRDLLPRAAPRGPGLDMVRPRAGHPPHA